MMRSVSKLLIGLVVILGAQACTEGFEPSLLEEPKILALRAIKVEGGGDAYTLEALTKGVDSLAYTVCGTPWLPTENGLECPHQTVPVPAGDTPLSGNLNLDGIPIPEGLSVLYIRADAQDPSVLPAILNLNLTDGPRNPPLEGLLLDGSSPADWKINAEKTVEVQPVWAEGEDGTETTTAFFTTAGAFSPWRTRDGAASTLTLEAFDEPLTIYVISRYLGEGTTWVELEVTP